MIRKINKSNLKKSILLLNPLRNLKYHIYHHHIKKEKNNNNKE